MKRGADFFVAMMKEGHNKFWGSFYVVSILNGGWGHKKSPLFKRGGGGHEKFYPVLKGGCKKFRTGDFPIL